MLAIHDQFTYQLRNRLKTTGMGLGLVRLLQDAGRPRKPERHSTRSKTASKAFQKNRTNQAKNLAKRSA